MTRETRRAAVLWSKSCTCLWWP